MLAASKNQEEAWYRVLLEPSEGASTLTSDFWPPNQQESALLLFQATRFVALLMQPIDAALGKDM